MYAAEEQYEQLAYLNKMNPGRAGIQSTYINDNYVNRFESSMSLVETQYSQSRYKANLNAPAFGATSQAYLPTRSLIGDTYLIVTLEADGPQLDNKYLLPTGWGLRLINNLNYTMPADTIGQTTITNDELYHYLYCQSKDYASTSQLFKLMGPSTLGSTGGVPPTAISASDAANYTATILLPLPWCSLGPDTKPIDASIFGSGQIFINITFAQPGAIFQKLSGSGTGTLKIGQAILTFRQGEMTNEEFSLRSLMIRNPSFEYNMPYIRSQNKSIGTINVVNSGSSYRVTTFISGMFNGDLVGMCISAHRIPSSGNVGNFYEALDIYDLTVSFGGTVFYNSPLFSHRLFNFQSALSAGYDTNDIYNTSANPGPVQNFPHIINFSRLRSMNWEYHYFNTPKWDSQTFNIDFGVPADIATKPGYQANVVEVRITMFYNMTFGLSQYRTQQRLL